jgi:hypothetical protein
MALSTRHRWCISKIVEAFAPTLDESAVQAFIRDPANLSKFNSFFAGEGSSNLFIFYQVSVLAAPTTGVDRHRVSVQGQDTSTEEETDWSAASSPPVLFISEGNVTGLASKACVFVRNSNKPIDTATQSDTTVLCCELAGSALQSIETFLSAGTSREFARVRCC